MTEEQIKQKFKETYPDLMCGDTPLSPYFDIWEYAIEIATKELQIPCNSCHLPLPQTLIDKNKELQEENKRLLGSCEGATMMYKDLTKAKEIIKDFLLMAKVEHLENNYETVDEAKQFLNSEVEK